MISIQQIGSCLFMALFIINPFLSRFYPDQKSSTMARFADLSLPITLDKQVPFKEEKINQLIVPFNQMKFNGKTFTGIYDTTEVWFRMPVDWQLISGSLLTLKYSIRMPNEESQNILAAGGYDSGSLYIMLNYVQLAVVHLDSTGDYQINIPISLSTAPQLKTDNNVVGITFRNGNGCKNDNGVSVYIDPTSTLTLTYIVQSTAPKLSNLPSPFFLPGNVAPQYTTTIVVPNKPSAEEIQAALSVSAGLGSLSKGEGELNLITLSDLTDEIRKNNHLVIIGKSLSIPILKELPLLVPLNTNGFKSDQFIGEDDGVIQLINSPWNSSRALLLVNGDTDKAVVKAGQSIRTRLILVPGYQGLAIIKNSTKSEEKQQTATETYLSNNGEDQNFQDMGYADVVLNGVGNQTTDYSFFVKPGQVIGNDAYLDLNVSPSTALYLSRTLLNIRLNDYPVYSANFSQQLSSEQTIHIPMDRSIFVDGRNVIRIEMSLTPKNICDNKMDQYGGWNNDLLWSIAIHDNSLLHLPVTNDEVLTPNNKFSKNLSLFPDVFIYDPSLENLTFILSAKDSANWTTAAQIAFTLGNYSNYTKTEQSPVLLHTRFNDELDDLTALDNENVIVVGMNDELGDYNQNNSALIEEYDNPVTYRVLPDISLGYVDLVPSIWNNDYNILLVRGNNIAGVEMAGDVLTQAKYDGFLTGSSLITNGSQIYITKP